MANDPEMTLKEKQAAEWALLGFAAGAPVGLSPGANEERKLRQALQGKLPPSELGLRANLKERTIRAFAGGIAGATICGVGSYLLASEFPANQKTMK